MKHPYCSCAGKGAYTDARCVREVCDHLNYPITSTPKITKAAYGVEKVHHKIKRGKVMDCPVRTCVCPAGQRAKRAAEAATMTP